MITIGRAGPGTGKSTYLENKAILSEDIDNVFFCGFNKANIAKTRKRLKLKRGQGKYFKTLHGIANEINKSNSSIRPYEIMENKHYYEFSKTYGYDIYYKDGILIKSEDAPLLQPLYYFMKTNQMDFFYDALEENYSHLEGRFSNFYKDYEEYKENNGLKDFDDLLLDFKKHKTQLPKFSGMFIDEAQDFNKLHWDMLEELMKWPKNNNKDIFIVGDDKQAIYSFLNSDIKHFINYQGDKIEYLRETFRLNPNTLDQYFFYEGLIREKVETEIHTKKPRLDHRASIIVNLDDIEDELVDVLNQGKTIYCLGRTNYELPIYKDWLEENGFKFSYKSSVGKKEINNKLANIKNITLDQSGPARITVQTIHQSKGLEADYVLLLSNITKNVLNNLEENTDEELRLLLTAATRAKERFFIVDGECYRNKEIRYPAEVLC